MGCGDWVQLGCSEQYTIHERCPRVKFAFNVSSQTFRLSRVILLALLCALLVDVRRLGSRSYIPLLVVASLFFVVLQAGAVIDITRQMDLGNPSNATSDTNNHSHFLVLRPVHAMDYNDGRGQPNWVSWNLTASDLGTNERSASFFVDTNLPASFYKVGTGEYSGSGYNRGHMCPSADRTDTEEHNDMVFYMSNVIPQAPDNNQGVWGNFESYCRTLAQASNEVLITCGPSGFDGTKLPSGYVAIPTYTWKIAVVVPGGAGSTLTRIDNSTRVISLKVPNSNNISTSWQNFVTTAKEIQTDTGFTFFTALPPETAAVLRNRVDGQTNPPPIITSFSPVSGAPHQLVTLIGTNLGTAAYVTFNGASAAFTVDTTNQITLAVPTNATSGPISVTTVYGTAISEVSFTVTVPNTADLTIVGNYTNAFVQGQSGANYDLHVSNFGTVTSTGLITVSNALPNGWTATAIAGDGWTADLNTLTCTRTDGLAPGQTFPAIRITVDLAANAPLLGTNRAVVFGGGDVSPANNLFVDVLEIESQFASDVVLAGWDVNALPGGANAFGPSPFAPGTTASHVTVSGLTRGTGVGTNGTAAARAWGGTAFTNVTSAGAVAGQQFATFTITANATNRVSIHSLHPFAYRRSATGPTNGLLQYRIGSGPFVDAATFNYPISSSSGSVVPPIALSDIAALQNVGPGTNITFRLVNWGGTSSAGTWYIYDTSNSLGLDFAVSGTVTPFAPLSPVESWRLAWFGTTLNTNGAADGAITANDGLPNLVKYALGLNPFVATNSPVTLDISSGYLRLSTPRNPDATDVTLFVEVASALNGAWTTNGTTVQESTPTLLRVSDNTPVSAADQRWMRLRVSRP
jgi:DNA/RNA endonuclease G (NUC1)